MHEKWSPVLVHGCVVLLGINSLISSNGLWMELPIMARDLPEGWALASYLTAIIQLANIGPIIFSIHKFLQQNKFIETYWLYAMLINGFFAAILMGLFWEHTVTMNGKEHSIPLFILTFFLALVDSLSSVVCLPFMALLKPIYVNSYMIGEGLSGFLPSVAALIQGVDEDPGCRNVSTVIFSQEDARNYTVHQMVQIPIEGLRFTASAFFYFLGCMMVFSLLGFLLLSHNKYAKSEYVVEQPIDDSDTMKQKEHNLLLQESSLMKSVGESSKVISPKLVLRDCASEAAEASIADYGNDVVTQQRNKNTYFLLLGMQAWISCLSLGAMPSVQSYSCAPYGPLPFHFAVLLSSLANPVAGFIAIWIPLKSPKTIVLLTGIGTAVASYLMLMAVMSPAPPMVNTLHGSIIMIIGWISFSSIFGYSKVAIACLLRDIGHNALFWCGVMTQIGATVGAILLFILVNVLGYFHEDSQC